MRVKISDYLDKKPNFDTLYHYQQVKYIAYFWVKIYKDEIFTKKNISDLFDLAYLSKPRNLNREFKKLVDRKEILVRDNSYIFERSTYKELETEFSATLPNKKVTRTLRDLLPKIIGKSNQKFLEEAISCYEIKSYRASIIMTWILTMDCMYNYVLKNKLNEFNTEFKKKNLKVKIKEIKVKNDFSELKESTFIEVCRSANIVNKDIRKILDEKLGIRNTYAHPNDLKVRESKATSFIEDLVENIIIIYI